MIVVKEFPNETFATKEQLHKALRENKAELKAKKAFLSKEADAFSASMSWSYSVNKGTVSKQFTDEATKQLYTKEVDHDENEIEVKVVVNSCGWFDSHRDVHLEGCWNKTVKDNKRFKHLQEHKATFSHLISKNVKISVEKVYIQGVQVDALVMVSRIKKKDNPLMFEKYMNGDVDEHSVGMFYIWDKLYLCIDSNHEDDREEKENYDKYITQVINKEEVEIFGYFWGVGEAKGIEGSAVVFGSNSETPTVSVTLIKNEPPSGTQHKGEPTQVTPKLDYNELFKGIKNLEI